jgi:hypothetical protein
VLAFLLHDHVQAAFLAAGSGRLTVTSDLRNQEVDLLETQGTVYWEGDVTITGKIGGATVSGDG